ncbi:MAG TPA: MFS transporter [Herpetosiphonaceae bacterium]
MYKVPDASGSSPPGQVNDRREIFGWTMYDWANSAYTTTVVAALFGPYLTAVTRAALGENGVVLDLGFYTVTEKSFYPDIVSLSVILQVFMLPVLGAVADYSHLKKRLMAFFAFLGAIACCLMFFVDQSTYLLGGLLFLVANLSFGASIVFYNAFLNDITTEDQRDKVSSRGFALGYFGGGLLLAVNLAMVTFAEQLGMTTGTAVRLSLLSSGVWWGGFSIITFRLLKNRLPVLKLPEGSSLLTVGFRELGGTFRELRRLPHTLKYLAGYLLYNDGIQTVIGLSSVFLVNELFVAKGLPEGDSQSFLLSLVLMIQFVAFVGALLFERIARWLGTKGAILVSLVIWSATVIYAYALLATTGQAYAMGAVIGIVLGGSQALSRSLFSKMIPRGREASFFGIYEVAERGTSWIGPFIFARVVATTGSYRQAILSLIVLFVLGMIIVFFTNTDQAILDAGNTPDHQGAGGDTAIAGIE